QPRPGRVGHPWPGRHISGGMPHIPFRKMHGLGNDFVVLDRRRDSVVIDAATARALADRRTGIGCDQLILIEPAHDPAAQIFMRILNADGSEAEACGTGACAALVAASRRGLTGRRASVMLDGGTLDINWREDGHVVMTGPVTLAFEGTFDPALLAGAGR